MAKVKEQKKAKAKAAAFKGPGVIAAILDVITNKGPINKADILKALVKKFPDRDSEKMATTIKAQLTGSPGNKRIEREKGVKLVVSVDGGFSIKGGKDKVPTKKAKETKPQAKEQGKKEIVEEPEAPAMKMAGRIVKEAAMIL